MTTTATTPPPVSPTESRLRDVERAMLSFKASAIKDGRFADEMDGKTALVCVQRMIQRERERQVPQ